MENEMNILVAKISNISGGTMCKIRVWNNGLPTGNGH